ncbi:MAG: hypothetical protein JWR72_3192 [Flavisolibacter sp.]|jgi:hypothetical protein|nr:hypothetical protein [Flavisolibacter sp.]
MMTNQQPWQAIVNTALLAKIPKKENSLSVVSKEFTTGSQKSPVLVMNFSAAKRYSFDDNGGGYLGL